MSPAADAAGAPHVPGSSHTLSEARSKELLARFGIPFPEEQVVGDPESAAEAARGIGFPVVVKLNGERIAHKTERGLVRLNLSDAGAVRQAAAELLGAATPEDGEVSLLVAPMLRSTRELIAGLARDPQFGMTVMLGVGGVLAEAVADVTIRLVPIEREDAEEMIEDLSTQRLLGAFRGEPPVDRSRLADLLLALSQAALAHPEIVSVDLNPVLIAGGEPIAVDALVEVEG
ncbi:MAG: acetate--CoA ligase family protein [Acidimicrobiales bacterium]|jgi:acetyl-CoA synthetase (ADP-forming)